MESVKNIRNRITKNKKHKVLTILSIVCAIASIILGVLIYMKKDENGTFLKNNFNVNVNFSNVNNNIDKFVSSLFSFNLLTGNSNANDQMVQGNNLYYRAEEQDHHFYSENNEIAMLNHGVVYYVGEEEDGTYSILVEYNNDVIAAYYNVLQPLVKTYDVLKVGDTIGYYQDSFKALFKHNDKLISYEDVLLIK